MGARAEDVVRWSSEPVSARPQHAAAGAGRGRDIGPSMVVAIGLQEGNDPAARMHSHESSRRGCGQDRFVIHDWLAGRTTAYRRTAGPDES